MPYHAIGKAIPSSRKHLQNLSSIHQVLKSFLSRKSSPLLLLQRLQNLRFYSVGFGNQLLLTDLWNPRALWEVVRADIIPGVGLCTQHCLRTGSPSKILLHLSALEYIRTETYTHLHACTYMDVCTYRNT